MTRWEVHTNRGQAPVHVLSTEEVREQLYRGQLHPEDWARSDKSPRLRQLATLDEFASTAAPARSRRRHDEEDAGLEMTSMIDVTFLLLIFFMITATFHLQKGLEFPPAQTDDEKAQRDEPIPGLDAFTDHIVVEIDAQDHIALKRGGASESIAADEIASVLQKESQAVNKHKLMIMANELASHEAIVTVINGAALAKISDITLADITTNSLPGGSKGPPQIRRQTPTNGP